MKKGFMYGAWSFYLDVSDQAGTELDDNYSKKVLFFSEWSYDDWEYNYYKNSKNQYYFLEKACGDDDYSMGSFCKFLWYYWMFDMSNNVMFTLFMVDLATKFEYLTKWQKKAEGVVKLFQ